MTKSKSQSSYVFSDNVYIYNVYIMYIYIYIMYIYNVYIYIYIICNILDNKSKLYERYWSKFDQENFILGYFSVDWEDLCKIN